MAGAHIATCARCQAELDGLRRLSAMLRRSLSSPLSPDWTGFWEGVRRGIEAPRVETVARRRSAWLVRPRYALGAVAALAAAALMVVWQVPRTAVTPVAEAAVSVTSADTDRPEATVMVYSPPERDLAVVWLFD